MIGRILLSVALRRIGLNANVKQEENDFVNLLSASVSAEVINCFFYHLYSNQSKTNHVEILEATSLNRFDNRPRQTTVDSHVPLGRRRNGP